MSDPNYIYTDSSKMFRLTLYRKYLIGETVVGSYVGCANGIYGGKTFSNLSQNATYCFVLDPVDDNFDMTGYYFTGYGNVTNVTVNN